MTGTFARIAGALLASAVAANAAHAATNECVGQVLEVALNPTGVVYANVQGVGMRAWCDVTTARTTNYGTGYVAPTPKEGCSTLYATLLTAKSTGRPVTLYFYSAIGDCATNGNPNDWFNVTPYWVVLMN